MIPLWPKFTFWHPTVGITLCQPMSQTCDWRSLKISILFLLPKCPVNRDNKNLNLFIRVCLFIFILLDAFISREP